MVPTTEEDSGGHRYFLRSPLTLVVLAVVAQQWQPLVKGRWTMAFIAAFLIITDYSFLQNTYKGG